MSQQKGWTPIKRGKIYCSPRCGGGCTVADHDRAERKAARLVRLLNRMTGKGWEPVIWENLGWHFRVVKGLMEVYDHGSHGKPRYWAVLQTTPQQHTTDTDPVGAVMAALGIAKHTAAALTAAVAKVTTNG